jgi:hypothetical protein
MRWMIRSIKCERGAGGRDQNRKQNGPGFHLYLTPFQSLDS